MSLINQRWKKITTLRARNENATCATANRTACTSIDVLLYFYFSPNLYIIKIARKKSNREKTAVNRILFFYCINIFRYYITLNQQNAICKHDDHRRCVESFCKTRILMATKERNPVND